MGDGAVSSPACASAPSRRRVWNSCWSMWRASDERDAEGAGAGLLAGRAVRHVDDRGATGTREFYEDVERRRYELEPFIPGFAEFEHGAASASSRSASGSARTSSSSCGAGADATGVDLTEASVEAVRERLALEGLEAELRVADAESLPFGDGEIRPRLLDRRAPPHARHGTRARRDPPVLRPGGEARIMLYSRRSWVALGVWLRYGVLRGRPLQDPTEAPRRLDGEPWHEGVHAGGSWTGSSLASRDVELRALRHAVRQARRWPAGRAAPGFGSAGSSGPSRAGRDPDRSAAPRADPEALPRIATVPGCSANNASVRGDWSARKRSSVGRSTGEGTAIVSSRVASALPVRTANVIERLAARSTRAR